VSGLDRERWHSIAVVPVRDWLWTALEAHGIEPMLLTTRGSFDLGYLNGIARLIRRHNVQLIQTHLLTTSVYASLAAIPWRVPVVSTFHGPNDVPAQESHRAVKFRILRRRRNRYVLVSHGLQRWFVAQSRVEPERTCVIHNGIDCQLFRPERDDAMRAELGVRPGDVLVGAVGNLRTPKDYPTFLRMAALLARGSTQYRFVIAGAADEPIISQLVQLRAELGLEDRLQFAGFRPDIERVMNALDVYVLSSATEGFSLTTVQAMACGVPVVATRCGGPEEIVIERETGLLVRPGAADELAAAVEQLVHDEALRQSLTRAGRDRAVRDFSIDSMVHGYAALYENLHPARSAAAASRPVQRVSLPN
jgi:glycosyltransferase involved in cell wall biosynthesis